MPVCFRSSMDVENAQVKVFEAPLGSNLQAEINDWLKRTASIHLINMTQSSTNSKTIITMIYIKKSKGLKVAQKK